MRSSGVSDDFHPGDIASTQEIKHRHAPRRMKFHTAKRGADPVFTRIMIAALLFILAALFSCLAMWLSTLGPFTGAPMVLPGIVFSL